MTEITTTFDYEEIDPETRISLKQRASRIGERTRRMATDIWENGREFAEAQQELASYGNGRFLAWVETETGYSKSTVYRMIDVHQRLDFPKLGKTDIAASALYLLASASTPDEARAEAMQAAEQGEAISHGRAKEIVQAHKPKPDRSEEFAEIHRRAVERYDLARQAAADSDGRIPPRHCPRCQAGGDSELVGDNHWRCTNCGREYDSSGRTPGLANPYEETAVTNEDADKPQQPRLAIWQLERHVRAWLESDSAGQTGFSDPIDALRNIKNRYGGWRVVFDHIKAVIGYTEERPFKDGDLIQAINNVIAQEEANKRDVLNEEQTADEDDYNYADELQQQIAAAETAVSPQSQPHAAKFITDLIKGNVPLDPRLTALSDAINTVTRLTADKTLTIDVVGPLARALNFLEDAKTALARRREYAAWLRYYEDDDGRRWQDLSDNQTWHKNSPCFQAFTRAFPDETFQKSALMDARQQLERQAEEDRP